MPAGTFILGKHRSGTTWLGNLLCQHPDIYGVQNPQEHGIWESAYFSGLCRQIRRDPRTPEGFRRWTEVVSQTNYIRFSLFPVEKLAGIGPDTCSELFRKIMDYCANAAGARVWIEKTPAHTLLAKRIAREYPDARFLSIRRNFDGWLRSSIRFSEQRRHQRATPCLMRLFLTARVVASRIRYEKALRCLRGSYKERLLEVNYADLIRDREQTLRRICDFLGLANFAKEPGDVYTPNSSFKPGDERHSSLSEGQLVFGRAVYGFLQLLPRWLIEAPSALRNAMRRPKLPSWTWADASRHEHT